MNNESSIYCTDSPISIVNSSQPSHPVNSVISYSTNDNMNYQEREEAVIETNMKLLFPDTYLIPKLPTQLTEDIKSGALDKFGPHHTNRQILIDIITYDLIHKYNLFYPTHRQFDCIGTAIVEQLKLPLTKDNIGIWKDAVQTKLKKKRVENKDHAEVKYFQSKYSRFGSGRPVKRLIGEIAQRDKQKQILLLNYDDIALDDLQTKVKNLRDDLQLDYKKRLQLWNETVHIRRKAIRDRPTSEILEEFPGYKDPVLVFEEIKTTMGVDLRAIVRRQIPVLLEKMVETPVFITDSPPIQLVRVLCRYFEESVHHIYSTTEPTTPYPTMVLICDTIHVYVDFISIVSTTSPEDALALLISMHAIFELNFNKTSRATRLLYAIAFTDKRFLSNSVRRVIQAKNIDIYSEKSQKIADNSTQNLTISATTNNNLQYSSQNELNVPCNETVININCLNKNDEIVETVDIRNKNESNDKTEETNSFFIEAPLNRTLSRRKQPNQFSTKPLAKKKKLVSFDDDCADDPPDENNYLVSEKSRPIRQQANKKRRW